MEYTSQDVLRLAKRVGNPKRSYLLVNPLQAKHMPVAPSQSLEMMRTLGRRLAEKYPDTGLIVGFAETATAIGAAVASCFPDTCLYMHTTREALPEEDCILFLEEHSHATEQKLHRAGFLKGLAQSGTILFVEDEISTGRTLLNMLRQLRSLSPEAAKVRMVAASVINRLSEENRRLLSEAGIECEALVQIPEVDYTAQTESMQVSPAEALPEDGAAYTRLTGAALPDPRTAAGVDDYSAACRCLAECVAEQMAERLRADMRVLVLGTEECMYPALTVGRCLEELPGVAVRCHATTRSPIGVGQGEAYPIRSGCRLRSFYEEGRVTFLYDLEAYDAVIVVSDTPQDETQAMGMLAAHLKRLGAGEVYYAGCGQNV